MLPLLLGVMAGAVSDSPEALNHLRLRAMPLSQRAMLAQRLQTFDTTLTRAEQDALCALDQRIEQAAPEERERYRTLAHQYLLWLRSLPEKSVRPSRPRRRPAASSWSARHSRTLPRSARTGPTRSRP